MNKYATPSDPKDQLAIYKTMIDQNKFQLLEMSRRYEAMAARLTDAVSGEAAFLLEDYINQLNSLLSACDAVRHAINKRLAEMK